MKLSAVVLILAYFSVANAAPKPSEGDFANKYIIKLQDGVSLKQFDSTMDSIVNDDAALAKRDFSKVAQRFEIGSFAGYAGTFSNKAVDALKKRAEVAYVENDFPVTLDGVQLNPPSYGLTRVGTRKLALPGPYNFPTTAEGITAYIIDTGINAAHNDFGNRAVAGANFITGEPNTDLNGHGTHVAGTIGGNTFGVAKGVRLVAVKVLNAKGSGTGSGVIAGINWVAKDCKNSKKCVANMSLGGAASKAIDDAVNAVAAKGITFVVAAGNDAKDACTQSPARAKGAIAVGATDKTDNIAARFSNFGKCVGVFAPGDGITSAWIGSKTATNTISGTSMASPHVAGVAALYLKLKKYKNPAAVYADIKKFATKGVIKGNLRGSPNLLAFNDRKTK
jgi:subtilisin family serine protease